MKQAAFRNGLHINLAYFQLASPRRIRGLFTYINFTHVSFKIQTISVCLHLIIKDISKEVPFTLVQEVFIMNADWVCGDVRMHI